jgi:hypothetical protein
VPITKVWIDSKDWNETFSTQDYGERLGYHDNKPSFLIDNLEQSVLVGHNIESKLLLNQILVRCKDSYQIIWKLFI